MAFSLSIWGTPKGGSSAKFDMKPLWWNKDQLMQDKRLVGSEWGGYTDYYGVVSLSDMREFHERFKKNTAYYEEEIKLLDALLYDQANEFANFHIKIEEWESGF